VDKGIPHGQKRLYRIKAVDEDGLESEWSEPEEGMAKPLPDPPEDLEVVYGDEGIRLLWGTPAQFDVSSYKVYKKGFLGSKPLGSSETTQFELAAKDIGKAANVYVTSIDEDGLESSPSKTVSVDTRTIKE
jgi:fibronectin type 3 domain-containing protein